MYYDELSLTVYNLPILILENDIVVEINSHFNKMCGYEESEIVGKSTSELWESLRITPSIDLKDYNKVEDYYLFTKTLDCKNFNISIQRTLDTNHTMLIFHENLKFDFEDRSIYLNQILKDNLYSVCVLSAKDLTILKANDKFFNIFVNYSSTKEKYTGKRILDILSESGLATAHKVWADLVEYDKSIHIEEMEFTDLFGNVAYLEGQIAPIHINNKLEHLIMTTIDITEKVLARKQLEEQSKIIQQQNRELEAILENISDGVFFAYKDEKFNLLNSAAKQFAYEPEKINYLEDGFINTEFMDMDGNAIPSNEMPLQRSLRGERVKNLRAVIKLPHKEIVAECSSSPIYDKEGNLVMAVVCTHDITELVNHEKMIKVKNKQLEVILEKSEENVNKEMEKTIKLQEELFTNISHELKTPLNVIHSTVQLFNMYLKNGSLDDKKDSITRYTESIIQNCYRLSKLINNIIDLSKMETGFYQLNLSNNNIVEVVEKIVMSVLDSTNSRGLNIIFDTDVEEKIIAIDPEKIERTILNLLSNAIKFSDPGDEIYVSIIDKNEFVDISVKDNGIGVEENHLHRIFERFAQIDKSLTRNAEGTGMGLSLVKSIVDLHGGNICVESVIGKGSNFTVTLPSKRIEKESTIQNSFLRGIKESIDLELSDI